MATKTVGYDVSKGKPMTYLEHICLFCWINKLDAWFTNEKGEAMWGKIIQAIQWSWSQMTLVSGLLLLVIISLIGLAWLSFSDRKRFMSKAYWRGWEDAMKESKK